MMRILCSLLLMLLAATSTAELYRWTDENGKQHFSDQPPPGSEAEVIDQKLPPAPGRDGQVDAIEERLKAMRDKRLAEERERKQEKEQAQRQLDQKCRRQKHKLEMLSTRRVRYRNEDGEFEDASLEKLEADRQELREWIAENCD
jgi:putative protein kinase ArgK-like GTPase of G3E family